MNECINKLINKQRHTNGQDEKELSMTNNQRPGSQKHTEGPSGGPAVKG